MSKSYFNVSFLFLSLFLSLVLAVFPWSSSLQEYRPEIVCLVVLYWVFCLPNHLGVTFAFSIGLLQSVIEGGIWGAHALGLAVAVYCLERFRHRVTNAALWEQSLLIGAFVLVHQILVAWMNYLIGYPITLSSIVCTALFSGLFWPILFVGFGKVQRAYQLNN